jgi:hypothetical protein
MTYVFAIVIDIATFDIVPEDYTIPVLMDFTNTDAYNSNLMGLGFESSNFMVNMGSFVTFVALYFLFKFLSFFVVNFMIICGYKKKIY